jgi:hypothetical protein
LKDKIQIPNSETAVSVYAPALTLHQTPGEPGHTRDTPGRTRAHGSQITLRRTSQPSKPSSTPARHYRYNVFLTEQIPNLVRRVVMADCARRDKRNSRFPGRRDQ